MPKHVNRVPELKLHKSSGRAYVQADGRREYLGKFGSAEARERYNQWVARWVARDRTPPDAEPSGCAVADVISAFMVHAVGYYRSTTGAPTGEADNLKDALRPVLRLYGATPARGFGSAELEAVQADMIQSGLARTTINARVNRVRRAWRWAAKKKMVPASMVAELAAVEPLRKNRTTARESKRVSVVAPARIEATLPNLTSVVAAMVEFQRLTGCRVSEVTSIRGCDVSRGESWEYRPAAHKNDWREGDQERVIPLGPRARAIVERFAKPRADAYLFDPREAKEEARTNGKPSRPGRTGRTVGVKYDRRSYAQAIYRACDRTWPHPTISKIPPSRRTARQAAELKAWRKRHRWSPLQIRHTAGTLVRRDFGLEAAQAVLGHARADTTQIYADRLAQLARDVADATG